MFKIKLDRSIAVYNGGIWVSQNKSLEGLLNAAASPRWVVEYTPDMEYSIIQLVKTVLQGVEVLEYKKQERHLPQGIPPDEIDY